MTLINRLSTPRYFLHEFPHQTAAMILALLLAGVLETLGGIGLVPLLGLLLGTGQSDPIMLKVTNAVRSIGLEPGMEQMLILVSIAMAVKALLSLYAMSRVGYVVTEVMTRLRLALLEGLLKVRWNFFVAHRTGSLTNALSRQASQAGDSLRCLALFLSYLLQALAYLAAGLFVSWPLTCAGLALGAAFAFLFRGLLRLVHLAGNREIAAMSDMVVTFTEALAGAKPLKVMHLEESLLGHLRRHVEQYKLAMRQFVLGTEMLRAFHEPVITICLAVGILLAQHFLNVGAASLIVMAFFFHRILGRVSAAQQALQQYLAVKGALLALREKITELSDCCEEHAGRTAPVFQKQIAFKGVGFSREGKALLRDFDLTIPHGAVTVLCGRSGVGKTTVADLIAGLYTPDSGCILIDDIALEELDISAWRRQIGYVPQEVFLFHDTIAANLTLGEDYPKQELWEVLEAVGMAETVQALPHGVLHVVGEQGRKLSGGQRQRLMIARALIRKPRLLILDEATSGLDEETEHGILAAIAKLRGKTTILAVSHQPAVRGIADHVHILDGGRIRAWGPETPESQE